MNIQSIEDALGTLRKIQAENGRLIPSLGHVANGTRLRASKKTSPTQAGFGYVRDSIVLRIDCEIDQMGNTR